MTLVEQINLVNSVSKLQILLAITLTGTVVNTLLFMYLAIGRNKFHSTNNEVEHALNVTLNDEPSFDWLHKLYSEEFVTFNPTFFEVEVEEDREFLVVDYNYDNVNVHLLGVDEAKVLNRTFIQKLNFDSVVKLTHFKDWFENIADYHDDSLSEEIHQYKNSKFLELNRTVLEAIDTYKKSTGQSQLDKIQVHYVYTKNSSDQKVFVFKTQTVTDLLNTVLSDHLNFRMQIEDIDQNEIKLIKDLISDLKGN